MKSVISGGAVGRSGQVRVGDRILEIGGQRLEGCDHTAAVEAIRKIGGGEDIEFIVQSLLPPTQTSDTMTVCVVHNSNIGLFL